MNIEDILADTEMYFSQNILTLRDLAELGKNKINNLN